MLIQSLTELRQAFRHGPYAWPGAYPCFFVTEDGEALSFEAVRANLREVISAVASRDNSGGWRVIGFEINWQGPLYCAHTGRPIESAYGDGEGEAA